MFICIELNTTNSEIWAKVDKVLTEEFGFTHMLWGETVDTKKRIRKKLPSNLFYHPEYLKPGDIAKDIQDAVEEVYTGGYRAIIITSPEWRTLSRTCGPDRAPSIPNEDGEINTRQE